MEDLLKDKSRTDYCGDLTATQIKQDVVLMGWVAKRRDFGNLIFIDLRDNTGKVQIVFDKNQYKQSFLTVESLRSEYVVCVEGKVMLRSEQSVNKNLKTGNIEVIATNLTILSAATKIAPFSLDDNVPSDLVRLKNRYLDLRRPHLQNNLKLRYEVSKTVRNYLDSFKFMEIETPFLGKSTPEGARDYLVPSRVFPGSFFALPQSPQIYKQLLMIAGYDRYFQFAKCFRDEDLRADRQPEFTQIDIELSFVNKEEQVMALVEGLIKKVFKHTINYDLPQNFKVLTYQEAMTKYGSDKPDTRFGLEIVDISEIAKESLFEPFKNNVLNGGSVRLINGKNILNKLTRKDLDNLSLYVKEFGVSGLSYITNSNGEIKSPLLKFFLPDQLQEIYKKSGFKENDVLFLISNKDDELVLTALGRLRTHLADKLSLIDKNIYDVLWVKDFPLFEYSKSEERYVAKHHPFTSPKDEDLHLLESNPEKVRAKAYDIVINGYEAGGGSIRINNPDMQERMFKALGFTQQQINEKFGFFVEAFKYGTPPHGGLALGLDRLVMLLAKTTDIKEVIAFPKTQSSMDVMTQAPGFVAEKQLDELFIAIKETEK